MAKFFLLALLFVQPLLRAEEKPFVIGSILGQLGNKLFEIATTSAVAWDNGAIPCFPDLIATNAETQHFFFRCNTAVPSGPIEFEFALPAYGYVPVPYHPNMQLAGYMQNEKYFAHHRDRILELFAPLPRDLNYIKKKYGSIVDHPKTVSVHLRYYHAEKPGEEAFIQYEREYYEKALALFPDDSLFVVFSDNMAFAKENIPAEGRNVVYIEKEAHYIDFHLMSLCKNNIIGNSTFSWWAAWLNRNPDKIVVRPQEWLRGFADIGGPDEWIKIEAEGMQDKMKRAAL